MLDTIKFASRKYSYNIHLKINLSSLKWSLTEKKIYLKYTSLQVSLFRYRLWRSDCYVCARVVFSCLRDYTDSEASSTVRSSSLETTVHLSPLLIPGKLW